MSARKKTFTLSHDTARRNVSNYALHECPPGWLVTFREPNRSLDQSAKFHAICGDVAKQKEFAGKKRPLDAWKVLFVSGHAAATKEGSEVVPGLESEFVNIRESTATMTIPRMASLIEYCLHWCAENDVELKDADDIPDWVTQ